VVGFCSSVFWLYAAKHCDEEAEYLEHLDLCATAHVLVRCYSQFIAVNTSITPGEEVLQAADFLIKEGRNCSRRESKCILCLSLMRPGLYFLAKTIAGR
jgi:hypothetical protein